MQAGFPVVEKKQPAIRLKTRLCYTAIKVNLLLQVRVTKLVYQWNVRMEKCYRMDKQLII